MRAARLHGPADLRLHDEPDPVPGDGEELVRRLGRRASAAPTVTGTWTARSAASSPRGRSSLGHEIAGVVASGARRGLRVAVEPADPCDRCELCLTGRSNLCPDNRFLGFGPTDGGLRTAPRVARAPADAPCPTRSTTRRPCSSSRWASPSTRSTSGRHAPA